ncbi:2,3,4,5-tetrahydropyridine-2,6-carboxylate N-succinyltransferase [Pokkaliibacter plantistimulans]|uniref:2,3,4,5-tetrahydropyridine-2,6-dicarboxylate N-succinyltransferase n=1 Tax=Pokkaliibacter plantistimulans TaxID=1635171 RepID=A0ABX5M5Q1_9GAMM|nr:2,3,4,5-tetrahydropyridine-2,6-dicarboxylate N-succinyltransferase [Pokkaliibacter plantistimulans]PXF32923.1 2,3,4,5-tetrahydropyridine-2,6-carboxylate N-succinyltransferase [Pokkaliibacter plantistimulans]
MSTSHLALGIGIGSQSQAGAWLEVFYPYPLLNPTAALVDVFKHQLGYEGGNQVIALDKDSIPALATALTQAEYEQLAELLAISQDSEQPLVITILESDTAPASLAEVYLKLHLLSNRLVKPHQLNLTGMFGLLPNIAWTNQGPIALDELNDRRLQARLKGEWLTVVSVDKFPRMADYVVPAGVRIGDADRIRLGAHLGEGTTVMHEGFVNFNAGTLGTSMVEGRISAGVVVGKGSDLGGGCSTMGTLSGGNNVVISVGENCLLGANAGLGIPLGDRCTLEAGLYLTGGSKVTLLDDQGQEVKTIKASELAGQSDLLFRRNSQTGRIECKTNKSAIELNEALHAHN